MNRLFLAGISSFLFRGWGASYIPYTSRRAGMRALPTKNRRKEQEKKRRGKARGYERIIRVTLANKSDGYGYSEC
jgi:hypothetical protein